MGKFKLLIHPYAELDIIDAKEWYDNLGERFINEIDKTIKRINNNSLQFSEIEMNIRRAIVGTFPYMIFFYLTNNLINVFVISLASRNPKK